MSRGRVLEDAGPRHNRLAGTRGNDHVLEGPSIGPQPGQAKTGVVLGELQDQRDPLDTHEDLGPHGHGLLLEMAGWVALLESRSCRGGQDNLDFIPFAGLQGWPGLGGRQ